MRVLQSKPHLFRQVSPQTYLPNSSKTAPTILTQTVPVVVPLPVFKGFRMASTSITYTRERKEELKENIEGVLQDVQAAAKLRAETRGKDDASSIPKLVAVTKLKPSADILALYDLGFRDFGENYVQELEKKASELPQDIRWHFIGNLQSNKAKVLASVPSLHTLQTLDTSKKADILNKTRSLFASSSNPTAGTAEDLGIGKPLEVWIQVNTSGEDQKMGVELPRQAGKSGENGASDSMTPELLSLATHIIRSCPHLILKGLMTIGSLDDSYTDLPEGEENPDFRRLRESRDWLEEELRKQKIGGERLGLSMGMSADFVKGIESGSDVVRVGSRILGARPPKKTATT